MPSTTPRDRPGRRSRAGRARGPCPFCGVPLKLVPIAYGYPTYKTFEQARRGEVALGGCIVSDDDPKWACATCHEPLPSVFEVVHD